MRIKYLLIGRPMISFNKSVSAPILLALLFCPWPAVAQFPSDHKISADNLSRVSSHVWMIKGFPNIGIVVGKKATLVVDTGMGPENGKIVSDIAMRLSPKAQHLFLTTTHYHAEHASGDAGFPVRTTVIRPRIQQEELEAEGQKLIDLFSSRSEQDKELLKDVRIRKADILFESKYHLDLGGGVSADLFWFGPAHTRGDELIMVKPDSVLFSGDVVQNKTGPFFYCATCTPASWLAVLDQVSLLKPHIVVPDHSDKGDGSLITEEHDMLSFLQARIMAMKSSGKTADEATHEITTEIREKFPGWVGFNHLDPIVQKVYADSSAH